MSGDYEDQDINMTSKGIPIIKSIGTGISRVIGFAGRIISRNKNSEGAHTNRFSKKELKKELKQVEKEIHGMFDAEGIRGGTEGKLTQLGVDLDIYNRLFDLNESTDIGLSEKYRRMAELIPLEEKFEELKQYCLRASQIKDVIDGKAPYEILYVGDDGEGAENISDAEQVVSKGEATYYANVHQNQQNTVSFSHEDNLKTVKNNEMPYESPQTSKPNEYMGINTGQVSTEPSQTIHVGIPANNQIKESFAGYKNQNIPQVVPGDANLGRIIESLSSFGGSVTKFMVTLQTRDGGTIEISAQYMPKEDNLPKADITSNISNSKDVLHSNEVLHSEQIATSQFIQGKILFDAFDRPNDNKANITLDGRTFIVEVLDRKQIEMLNKAIQNINKINAQYIEGITDEKSLQYNMDIFFMAIYSQLSNHKGKVQNEAFIEQIKNHMSEELGGRRPVIRK